MSYPYKYITIFSSIICVVCICLATLPQAYAQVISGEIEPDEPWRIEAEQISYDPAEEVYIAEGNVVITHLDSRLRADLVRFQSTEMIAHASGNVFFTSGEDTLEGDRLIIDLNDETGTLFTGHIFIRESNFHITGNRIMKTGEDTYFIEQACLTTCEPTRPDWSFTGSNVHVTVEGYGIVKHAAFRVRNIPVLYIPFFIFPAKTERQSGLLPPHIEYSSRNGFEYMQPFFWAISDHSDATFYYHHIQNRGEKAGFEYRYMLSGRSRGTLMFDGFEDRKVDDDPDDPDREWGYTDDRFLRPNSDRYWFRMKADQELPAAFMAQLDIDIVSDQDYLRDFYHGYTGHRQTSRYFESEFGRNMDDRNDRVRENRLNLNRTWITSSLNTDLVWYDNVVARRQLDENPTLQRLPMISYNFLKQPLYQSRTYGSINTEYNYFFREDGVTGHRMDLHPRLYYPFYPANRFAFEPSVGFRQTVWYTDATRDDIFADPRIEDDMQRYNQRGIYDIAMELSTDFHRIFPVRAFGTEKVKHGILPMIRYSYIPAVNQTEFPDFDEIDRIESENQLLFSMTHFFTSRYTVIRPDADPEPAYNLFGRFMIEQPYDLDYDQSNEAFLPLYAELDITPIRLPRLHADAQYSHQENTFISSNTSLRFRDLLGSNFRIDYRYTRDRNKTVYLQLETPVKSWLTLYGDYERSLIDNTIVELNAGLRYIRDCWSLDFTYRVQEDLMGSKDERYFFMLHLYGLGGFGN